MKSQYLAITLLFVFGVYACNEFCNGHGTCEAGDKCQCYFGWGGADCSLRACPYGEAFVDLALGDLNHDGSVTTTQVKTEWFPDVGRNEKPADDDYKHRYAECSNAGLCNRQTGDCECFPGYEGSSCQRMSCATAIEGNPCSGHGSCLPSEMKVTDIASCDWSYKKTLYCKCDDGWSGFDCNERICPKGLDPLSDKTSIMQYRFTLPHNHTVARSLANMIPENVMDHYYEVTFGGVMYTTPVVSKVNYATICNSNTVDPLYKSNAIRYEKEISDAIKTIPPLSQSTVSIKCERGRLTGAEYPEQNFNKLAITINIEYTDFDLFKASTFTLVEMSNGHDNEDCKEFNSGTLADNTKVNGRDETGSPFVHPTFNKTTDDAPTCIPKASNPDADDYFYTPVEKVFTKDAQTSTCSNRGKCNISSGLCECFTGYYGAACENSLSIAV